MSFVKSYKDSAWILEVVEIIPHSNQCREIKQVDDTTMFN